MKKTILLAHRGITNLYPENTLESLSEIITLPFNEKFIYGIEFDIRLTKDNKIICFHDETTKRLTNSNYTIKKTDYSVLQELFISQTLSLPDTIDPKVCKIPLLEDVLKKLSDYNIIFNIELKSKKHSDNKKYILIENLMNLIKKYKIVDNTFITSFDHEILDLIPNTIKQELSSDHLRLAKLDSLNKDQFACGSELTSPKFVNIGYLYDGFDNKCLNDNCKLLCFNINSINDSDIKLIKEHQNKIQPIENSLHSESKILGCYTVFEKGQNTDIQYIINYDMIITDNIYKLIDLL